MTGHEEFFAELRAAREAKGVSLDDISRATLIDRKYLEAIEHAQEHILPAAYVRAFIREYAAALGFDPEDVMRRYDQSSSAAAQPSAPESPAPTPTAAAAPPQGKPWWENRWLQTASVGVAVVCVVVFILDIMRSPSSHATREIPFSTAVHENERRLFPGDTAQPATPSMRSDSLVLSAASLDSVWMELSIDGTPPVDYLFPPNVRRQWKAREKFIITLGNGGGMVFRLNSLDIGTLGKPGSVVRNFELSRKTAAAQKSPGATP
jgi:transcriptional regulator with XRE-family HTH domain